MLSSEQEMDAAAEAVCSVDTGSRVCMPAVFQASSSLMLALVGVPTPGFALLTGTILCGAEGPEDGLLTTRVLHGEHTLCRVLEAGRPFLTPAAGPTSNWHVEQLRELGSSPGCTILIVPILPPSGSPALGALLLEFPTGEAASAEGAQACVQLANVLGQQPRHREALRRLAGRLSDKMAPLGIASAQRPAVREEDDLLSEPSLAAGDSDGDWEADGEWEVDGGSIDSGGGGGGGAEPPPVAEVVSFRQHWNGGQVAMDRIFLLLVFVYNIKKILKARELSDWTPWRPAYFLTYMAALVGVLYWSLRWPRHYVAWRELPATLVPGIALVSPFNWEIMTQTLENTDLWQRGPLGGLLSFLLTICNASMIFNISITPLCCPKRFTLQLLAQAAYVAATLARVPALCGTPLLRHPASQRLLACAHGALRSVAGALGLPLPAAAAGFDSSSPGSLECKVMLSTAMLVLGYGVALVASATLEWRSYVQWGAAAAGPAAAAEAEAARGEGRGALRELAATVRLAALRATVVVGVAALTLAAWRGCAALYNDR